MEVIGKVSDVKILKQGRGGLNGLTIEFLTDKPMTSDSVVQLTYENGLKPFNVKEVEISGDKLLIRAVECGYWAKKLDNVKDLDLRTLLEYDVELVTDETRLAEINEQSCWC